MSPFSVFILEMEYIHFALYSKVSVFIFVLIKMTPLSKRSSVNTRKKQIGLTNFHLKTEQCERTPRKQ